MCGCEASQLCPSCNNQLLCDACDDLFHRHPSRANHKRGKVAESKEGATGLMFPVVLFSVFFFSLFFFIFSFLHFTEICTICGIAPVHAQCLICIQRLCLKCDMLYHSHPERKGHQRNVTTSTKTSRSEQERGRKPKAAKGSSIFILISGVLLARLCRPGSAPTAPQSTRREPSCALLVNGRASPWLRLSCKTVSPHFLHLPTLVSRTSRRQDVLKYNVNFFLSLLQSGSARAAQC